MYQITSLKSFDKEIIKLTQKNQLLLKKFDKVIDQFKIDPHYPGLKSHIVDYDSTYGTIWSSRVTGDIRILWAYDKDNNLVLILLKIGTHDHVY